MRDKSLIVFLIMFFSPLCAYTEDPQAKIFLRNEFFYGTLEDGSIIPLVTLDAYIPSTLPVLCTVWCSADLQNWQRLCNGRNYTEIFEDTPGMFYVSCVEPSQRKGFFRIGPFLSGPPAIGRDLVLGSSGEDVVDLQVWLTQKGFLKEPDGTPATIPTITGSFQENTQAAVTALQTSAGITANGVCNLATRQYILTH